MAFNHDLNDGQKFMGVFALTILAGGATTVFEILFWVILVCSHHGHRHQLRRLAHHRSRRHQNDLARITCGRVLQRELLPHSRSLVHHNSPCRSAPPIPSRRPLSARVRQYVRTMSDGACCDASCWRGALHSRSAPCSLSLLLSLPTAGSRRTAFVVPKENASPITRTLANFGDGNHATDRCLACPSAG